jgi:hypothetical protein
VLFKIYFEKACDKVNRSFLQQALRMKGFPPVWCDWVALFVLGGSVGILVNDDIGHYFHTLKGLCHGDPLSLLCYLILLHAGGRPSRRIDTTHDRRWGLYSPTLGRYNFIRGT